MDLHEVRRQWAERSGEFSPTYYAYRGADARSEAVRGLLDRFLDRDASVLELGCSSGRHLAHLHEAGFTDLAGVEVNPEAFAVMRETYPALAESVTFHRGAIEDLVADFADDRFDAVYSVETLQHLHPDVTAVFDELIRVTGDLLVTVENEPTGDEAVTYVDDEVPLYHRDWHRVFTDRGLVEAAVERGDRDTVRAFRHP